MTARLFMLVLSLAPTAALGLELCAGQPRSIEPDMQIQESDLTTESAQGAVLSLRALAREPDPSYEAELAMLNRLQILQGYTLRQKALEDRSAFGVESSQALESQRLFCSWLDTGAFWYD